MLSTQETAMFTIPYFFLSDNQGEIFEMTSRETGQQWGILKLEDYDQGITYQLLHRRSEKECYHAYIRTISLLDCLFEIFDFDEKILGVTPKIYDELARKYALI